MGKNWVLSGERTWKKEQVSSDKYYYQVNYILYYLLLYTLSNIFLHFFHPHPAQLFGIVHIRREVTFPASTNRIKSVNTQQISTLTGSSKNATCTNFHAVPFSRLFEHPPLHSCCNFITSHPPTHPSPFLPAYFFCYKKEQLAMWEWFETFADTFAHEIFAVKNPTLSILKYVFSGETGWGRGGGDNSQNRGKKGLHDVSFPRGSRDSPPPPLKKYTVKKLRSIIYGRDWILKKYLIRGKSSDQSRSRHITL